MTTSKPSPTASASYFKFNRKFLAAVSLACIGLGWIFALLVWANPLGLGATVFFTGVVLFALYLSRQVYYRKIAAEMRELKLPTSHSWLQAYRPVFYFPFFLAIWQVIISFAFLYRIEVYSYIFMWIFFLVTIPLLVAFLFFPLYPKALTVFNGLVFGLKYGIFSFIEGLKFIVEAPMNIFPIFRRRGIRMVALGLVVGVLLLLFFAWLLSAADPVFKSYVDRIWDEIVNFIKYLELFRAGRIFIMIIAPLVIGGGFLAISRYSLGNLFEAKLERVESWLARKEIATRHWSDFGFNIIVLGAVNLVFWGFVLVQLRYFFFGSDLTNILGKYTYAEYAQRGFVEMLVAVILAYPLLGWFANRSRFTNKVAGWLSSLADFTLVGALLIVLLSAFRRIALYQATYGYSLRRLFVILGVSVVATVLFGHIGIIIYKKVANVKRQFRFIGMNEHFFLAWVGLALLFTLTVMIPWPIFVTKANLQRYQNTGKIDLVYLYTAPEETLPTIFSFTEKVKDNEVTIAGVTPDQSKLTNNLLRNNLTDRIIEINHEIVRKRGSNGEIDGSVLAKIGGLNIFRWQNAYSVYDRLIGTDQQLNPTSELEPQLKTFFDEYEKTLVAGSYGKALGFWDPTFSAVDISAFSNCWTVNRYQVKTSSVNVSELAKSGSLENIPVDFYIDSLPGCNQGKSATGIRLTEYISIAIQNGTPVIKSANRLPLGYQNYDCDSLYNKCDDYFNGTSNRRTKVTLSDFFDLNFDESLPTPSYIQPLD